MVFELSMQQENSLCQVWFFMFYFIFKTVQVFQVLNLAFLLCKWTINTRIHTILEFIELEMFVG